MLVISKENNDGIGNINRIRRTTTKKLKLVIEVNSQLKALLVFKKPVFFFKIGLKI